MLHCSKIYLLYSILTYYAQIMPNYLCLSSHTLPIISSLWINNKWLKHKPTCQNAYYRKGSLMVADCLEYEEEDIKLIREKCHHDLIKCCEQLLEDWPSGDKGISPKSWSKEVLRKSEDLVARTKR